MFNPFDGVMPPVDDKDRFVNRQEIIKALDRKIKMRQHTVLMGVMGSGKTSLLNTYFNRDYCIQMTRDEKVLIVKTSIPIVLSGDNVFQFFSDQIISSLKILRACGQRELLEEIREEIKEEKMETKSSDAFLQWVVSTLLHDTYGFRMTIVLDDFELFTSSNEVKMVHHELLRSLSKIMQFVTATNFDLEKESLSKNIEGGSFWLQLFSGNEVLLDGFGRKEAEHYLNSMLEEEKGYFSTDEMDEMYEISGGIPTLLRTVARYAYEVKLTKKKLELDDFRGILPKVVEANVSVLENWYKYLTDSQFEAIQNLLILLNHEYEEKENPGNRVDNSVSHAIISLRKRGIFKPYKEEDKNGRERIITDVYEFNSVVLEKFSMDTERIQRILQRNHLKKEDESAAAKESTIGYQINITGPLQMVQNMQVVEQMNVNQLIHVLDDKKELKGYLQRINESYQSALLKQFAGDKELLSAYVKENPGSDSPKMMAIDEAVSKMSDEFIEELQPDEEGRQSIHTRFERVRVIHPEITDEMLSGMSEKAQFYLKIAVVVEDALAILETIEIGDISAQLVMYGKVLEQTLRDSFYPLFHQEEKLCSWDTFSKTDNARDGRYKQAKTFGRMTVTETLIGNYTCMIHQKVQYLADLSVRCKVQALSVTQNNRQNWMRWWTEYANYMNEARKLRNSTDHAGSEPMYEDLKKMCHYLFHDDGIINRSHVGKALLDGIK